MPEHLRALLVILAISVPAFALLRMAMVPALMPQDEFIRNRNLWFGITLAAFLSHNFWIFTLLSGVLLLWVGARTSNRMVVFFFVLFAVPLLAMRLIAEERRNQTMVLLTSAPISVLHIVLGKFFALLGMLLIILLLIAVMPLSLATATRLDFRLIASTMLGLALLAAAFSAVSLYVSSLTTHPIVAALGAFGALLAMIFMGENVADNLHNRGLGVLAALAQVFSPVKNFEPLGKGVIDSYAIICLILLALLFLALTVRQLEARRLRG